MSESGHQKPLTPAVLHILLALADEDRHGYAIMKQVKIDTLGQVTMGPGTLYGSLGRMMKAGFVEESQSRVDPEIDDERRIYYGITANGREALKSELSRYRQAVALAKDRKLALEAKAHGAS
ncbi:MAG: PadR family transcriptional regulator [Pseudomonadota bacterium]